MDTLIFEPQDTLFFRDGRPFNQGEGTAGVESQFPPSPMTLVGAARAAWASAMGWSGRGKWTEDIRQMLGGDDDELAGLAFQGPLLHRDGVPVFPAPACLMGKIQENKPTHVVHLKPSSVTMHCDLGKKIRLPVPDVDKDDKIEGRKLLSGWWLTQDGMQHVLNGKAPDEQHWIAQRDLWRLEPKVGITIDPSSGTTGDGLLYSTQHVRLREGVCLAMGIEGKLDGFPQQAQVVVGGESRSAWLANTDIPLHSLEASVNSGDTIRYAIHILTPLAADSPPQSGEAFCGLPGQVISACLPRAQRWGGWDSIKHQPAAMKPHLPPGSVIFMEAKTEDAERIQEQHGKTIGTRGSWGFGLIAIGQWN